MSSKEAVNANFKVIGSTRLGIKQTQVFSSRGIGGRLPLGHRVSYWTTELSMDRNKNLFRQEFIDLLGTGAGMELFCGLQEQEFRLTVSKNVIELSP